MRRPLMIVAAGMAAGLGLSACDMTTTEREEAPPPPPAAEEPVVEDVEPEIPAESTEPSAPPPPASGDLGEARPSEESVEPDSETVFY